eukprot:TRINITY_DN38066_c0_g1_i1.p1 TRINITY_DN38066_c0_g1~~TRINITY_DN38066_c0_g1_i1.p1  ORF type:complete len:105 (+),score=11.60 TRINITY_DN38066_c0_g1_i1:684-998(+)
MGPEFGSEDHDHSKATVEEQHNKEKSRVSSLGLQSTLRIIEELHKRGTRHPFLYQYAGDSSKILMALYSCELVGMTFRIDCRRLEHASRPPFLSLPLKFHLPLF